MYWKCGKRAVDSIESGSRSDAVRCRSCLRFLGYIAIIVWMSSVHERETGRKRRVLTDLFHSLFVTNEELRRFICRCFDVRADSVVASLPGEMVSKAEYVYQCVEILLSRGLAGQELRAGLMAEFPNRRSDILAIDLKSSQDARSRSPYAARFVLLLTTAAAIGAGLAYGVNFSGSGGDVEGASTSARSAPAPVVNGLSPPPILTMQAFQNVAKMCESEESCGQCECAPPRACIMQKCVDDYVGTTACSDPSIADILNRMRKLCKGLEHCSPGKIKELLMEGDALQRLLKGFPARFALIPPASVKLDSKLRSHLIERLQTIKVPLALSSEVIVIGFAPREGDKDVLWRSVKAVDLTSALITQVLDGGEKTFIRNLAGLHFSLDPSYFAGKFTGAFAAWNSEAEKRLRLLIERYPDIDDDEQRFLLESINRSVLIIPIPCN